MPDKQEAARSVVMFIEEKWDDFIASIKEQLSLEDDDEAEGEAEDCLAEIRKIAEKG